jgi:hypothetical protein
MTWLGIAGTGGASCGRAWPRPGEGDRNVRSVKEPVLGDLCKPGLPLSRLAVDDTEGLRRATRLDWTSATLVGVIGRALRAAAAAADESEGGADWSRRMKAEAAAVAAFGFAVSLVRGWTGVRCLREPPNMVGGFQGKDYSVSVAADETDEYVAAKRNDDATCCE